MTPEEINKAIAEACGKKYHRPTAEEIASGSYYQYEPNYYGDLNAMHEAVCGVSYNLQPVYMDHLFHVIHRNNRDNGVSDFDKHNATAAQRAEAFLRTLNLWVEDQPKDEDE